MLVVFFLTSSEVPLAKAPSVCSGHRPEHTDTVIFRWKDVQVNIFLDVWIRYDRFNTTSTTAECDLNAQRLTFQLYCFILHAPGEV